MSIRHKQHVFIQGDTWTIRGRLVDRDGNRLPLPAGSLLEWALLDETRTAITRATSADAIVITDATNGLIEITLTPNVTAAIDPGSYSDALRATIQSMVGTMWSGPIIVDASPFT